VSIGKYMQIFERNLLPSFSGHPKNSTAPKVKAKSFSETSVYI